MTTTESELKWRISDLSEEDRKSMEGLIKTLRAALLGCEHYAGAYVANQGSTAINLLQDLDLVLDMTRKTRAILIEKHRIPYPDAP